MKKKGHSFAPPHGQVGLGFELHKELLRRLKSSWTKLPLPKWDDPALFIAKSYSQRQFAPNSDFTGQE